MFWNGVHGICFLLGYVNCYRVFWTKMLTVTTHAPRNCLLVGGGEGGGGCGGLFKKHLRSSGEFLPVLLHLSPSVVQCMLISANVLLIICISNTQAQRNSVIVDGRPAAGIFAKFITSLHRALTSDVGISAQFCEDYWG